MLRFSMLVNGTPSSFFSSSCGLRQEDLMSPLLYVITVEALGRMISDVVSGGLLSGFFVGCLQMIHGF
jgi:hypothetical protein